MPWKWMTPLLLGVGRNKHTSKQAPKHTPPKPQTVAHDPSIIGDIKHRPNSPHASQEPIKHMAKHTPPKKTQNGELN